MQNQYIRNIGIDIDGVLFDKNKYELEKGIPFFSRLMNTLPEEVVKNPYGIDVREIYLCNEFQRYLFWVTHILEYLFLTEATPEAKIVIKKWMEEQRNVFIISGRKDTGMNRLFYETLVLLSRLSIKLHQIPNHGLYFCSDSNSIFEKQKLCSDLNIDLMIDDRVDITYNLRNICNSICVTQKEEKEIEIPIAKDLIEVDQYIRKLEKKM